MCGRFTIMTDPPELRELLELGNLPSEFHSDPNISPGQLVPVIRDPKTRDVELFKWGLIPWWTKDPKIGYKMFNARAETIAQKPSFKIPFARKRCLIPADGFYEWKMDGNKKFPFLFTMKDRKPLTFAGLWESWKDEDGVEINSCTIITTEPNRMMAEYHNRMPVILLPSTRWLWLESQPVEVLLNLLVPVNEDLMALPERIERL